MFLSQVTSIANLPPDARCCAQVVDALVRSGVAAGDIGVIAPYRAQLQLLLHRIQHAAVDVYTVDRYQGRDKDCIIVSLVRSNDMRMVLFFYPPSST